MKLLEGQEAGEREKEGMDICRESTDRKKEGRDVSVEGKGETEGKVVLLCTGSLEGSKVKGSGEKGSAIALLQQFSASPGTVCAMRQLEYSNLSLATETPSWVAGWWVTHSR